jgi:hypothetical protein
VPISIADDKMDPVLEISLEEGQHPVCVRLVGLLDGATSASLLTMVDGLLRRGLCELSIDLEAAEVVPSGKPALRLCQQWADEIGGSVFWRPGLSPSLVETHRFRLVPGGRGLESTLCERPAAQDLPLVH